MMADIWLPSDGNIQVFIDKNGVLSVTERVDMAPRPIVPRTGFAVTEKLWNIEYVDRPPE